MSGPSISGQSVPGPSIVDSLASYLHAHASQVFRFVLIGAAVAAMNLAFLYLLRSWLRLPDPVAVAAMYVFGAVVHFTSHRWITYRAQDDPALPQGFRYAIMFVLNLGLMQALVWTASRIAISAYLAVIASIGLTMVGNFLFMTHVVFAKASHNDDRE